MPHRTTAAVVWPLPTLEPPHQPTGASRRSAQRQSRAAAVTNVANNSIRSCNALARSFYRVTPFHLQYQSPVYPLNSVSVNPYDETRNPATATQSQLIARIYEAASRFVSRRGASASECDDLFPCRSGNNQAQERITNTAKSGCYQ